MLKELKEEVLTEMQSESPDDKKIAMLADKIESLDLQIKKLESGKSVEPQCLENKSDETEETKIQLTSNDLAKVRWAYIQGEKEAMGCITLNPNKKQTTNKNETHLFSAMDVSNSMGDRPLEEMSHETIKIVEELILGGANVRLTLIAYGKTSNVFLDEELITRDNFNEIKTAIRKNIGDPWMGKIRSDTRFEEPLSDMFSRGSIHGNDSVYVWWSDGIENGGNLGAPLTNMKDLIKTYFPDGPTGKMCTATYKDRCGENTQMQDAANIWGENGFFTNIDTIELIAKFTKESLYDNFFANMAENIKITLPCGEERTVPRIRQIPIDITFTCPVTLELRVGATNQFALKDTLLPEINITCSTSDGETHVFVYPTIDQVQINPNTGELVSSVNTKYAHKLQEFYKMQKELSGLPDDAEKDLPLLKESQKILNMAGHWNDNGEFEAAYEKQGVLRNCSAKMVMVAAEHQRQAKDTYDEIGKLILAATRIERGVATKSDCAAYCSASLSVNQRSAQASRGQSQSSGYSAQTSAYGVSILQDNSDATDDETEDYTDEDPEIDLSGGAGGGGSIPMASIVQSPP
jgi:hypothetical protein